MLPPKILPGAAEGRRRHRLVWALSKMRAGAVLLLLLAFCAPGCAVNDEVVRVTHVQSGELSGLGPENAARVAEIKKARGGREISPQIGEVLGDAPQLSVAEYRSRFPEAECAESDYQVGGTDVLSVVVYDEPDLSKDAVPVSREGYISFPLVGRVKVAGLTPVEIERLMAHELAAKQYLLDAHVSVMVREYNSRHFMVLGTVNAPGTYTLQAGERVLNALSKVGGFDRQRAGSHALLIRTLESGTETENRVIVKIDLDSLLKRGDQASNLYLRDGDMLFVPPVSRYYIIGQVQTPGSYDMPNDEVSLVEAIGAAGGFTPIAARNKTRIIRVEEGVEKIIVINVDAITREGRKVSDIALKPDDIVVVPESFF